MNRDKIKCGVCKEETEFTYGAIINGKGYIKGHKSCVNSLMDQFSFKKFIWADGEKGSYSPGWLNDVKHRKVVGGEVIRDYGKKFSFGS